MTAKYRGGDACGREGEAQEGAGGCYSKNFLLNSQVGFRVKSGKKKRILALLVLLVLFCAVFLLANIPR